MTPQHLISQLLESDSQYPTNLELLKKILITAHLGRLRINGLPPDNKIALGNYLFDDERIMFDFTRLSDESKSLFFQWLTGPHLNEKENRTFVGVSVNEYRGFTAESILTWWGRIKRWWQGEVTEHWKINDLGLSLNYQLTGIEMSHGKNGTLIGFDQFLVPPSGTKYKDPDDLQTESLGNTKRVFLTDKLVDQLTQLDIDHFDYGRVCKNPHPHSVDVINQSARLVEMHDYRKMQKFITSRPWYVRLWFWVISFFSEETENINTVPVDNSLKPLHTTDTVKIYQRSKTKEIIVTEAKPDIENIVFCGGGAKIFAHVGVWKALNESNIRPTKFAGSSAGAIMAMLCYLGYTADEISVFFQKFKQEHLIHFDIDRNGLSDPHSLKAALDFSIIFKVNQIVSKYNIPYPQGKITFRTLESIRQQCPDCGLGKELVVTATNKPLRKTRYFSLARSPDMEVSEAVKTSASFPVLYRPTLIDGEEHNDGGVLSNFPTEAFSDDHSTFLESEYGNNLKILAVQFDNGTERDTIDRVMDKVYRENFLLNWIYRLITGVSDPASGWEQDRLKLRKYAAQSVIVDSCDVSSSSFSVDETIRNKMIDNGYESTKSYLDIRYSQCDDDSEQKNKELMYSTFSSLGDLLAYCCYRGDKSWFEVINNLIVQSDLPNRTALMRQSIALRELYFKDSEAEVTHSSPNLPTFFGNAILQETLSPEQVFNHNVFLALYPIFLKLSPELLKTKADKKIFEHARHAISLHSPFHVLHHFAQFTGETHIILHILKNLIHELKEDPCESSYTNLEEISTLLHGDTSIFKEDFYGHWDLSIAQSMRVLRLINGNQLASASQLLHSLRDKSEPMQTITGGVFYDDFTDGSIEGDRFSFSA